MQWGGQAGSYLDYRKFSVIRVTQTRFRQMSSTSYYLTGTGEANKLHTAVLKRVHDNQVFIVAMGYGGGGVFEEFCGKFHWSDEKDGMAGVYALFHDPDEWENEVFESEVTDHFSAIEKSDKSVIEEMVQDLWDKYVHYDEESDTRLLRDPFAKAQEGYLASEDWDEDVVGWVSNNFWGLSLSFDW